jgi:hypothetical protein
VQLALGGHLLRHIPLVFPAEIFERHFQNLVPAQEDNVALKNPTELGGDRPAVGVGPSSRRRLDGE